jgi:hypothetical protein
VPEIERSLGGGIASEVEKVLSGMCAPFEDIFSQLTLRLYDLEQIFINEIRN